LGDRSILNQSLSVSMSVNGSDSKVPLVVVSEFAYASAGHAIAPQLPPLDVASQVLVQQLYGVHKSAPLLLNQIEATRQTLANQTAQAMAVMKDRLTISQLLSGLLLADEKVACEGRPLEFASIQFYAVNKDTDQRGPMIMNRFGGCIVLTNQRLLLLASSNSKGASIAQIGDPKKAHGGYTVSTNASETLWFFPIPIHNFRHVTLTAATGTDAKEYIRAEAPGCWGCCPCLCSKGWNREPQVATGINERVLEFGVMLPPWNTKAIINVQVRLDMPLSFVRDLLGAFQYFSRPLPLSAAAPAASAASATFNRD